MRLVCDLDACDDVSLMSQRLAECSVTGGLLTLPLGRPVLPKQSHRNLLLALSKSFDYVMTLIQTKLSPHPNPAQGGEVQFQLFCRNNEHRDFEMSAKSPDLSLVAREHCVTRRRCNTGSTAQRMSLHADAVTQDRQHRECHYTQTL